MTISSNLSTVTRNGNGVATQFSFPFKVWDVSQLDVYITDPTGVATSTGNFTAVLSGTGGSVTYPASGGTVLPAGWKIVINRNMPFTQNVDLVNGQAFYPDVIEQALDQLTATCQQLDEGLSRSVKVDPGQGDPKTLLTQIQTAVTTSSSNAAAAAGSATDADASKIAATAQANAAHDSAQAAANSASTAADAVSAAKAQAYAAHDSALAAANSASTAAQAVETAAAEAVSAATAQANRAETAAAATAVSEEAAHDSALAAAQSAAEAAGASSAATAQADAAANSASTAAQTVTTAAAEAVTAATAQANRAETAATATAVSEEAAASSAMASATSAANSDASANLAEQWASSPYGSVVENGEYSAKHYSIEAKNAVPDNLVGRVEVVEDKTQPATTTSRGIGKVATLADMEPGAVIENGPAVLAAGSDAERLLLRVTEKYDVGEFYYFRHPTLKPGFAPLQGGLISGAYQGKNITEYPIWDYLQTTEGQLLCKTEAEWQAMTTATWATLADGTTVGWDGIGGAPFYVQDLGTGTLRLPDLRGMYAEAAGFDSLGVGGVDGDKMRKIPGRLFDVGFDTGPAATGAFTYTRTSGMGVAGTTTNSGTVTFDPSRVTPTGAANAPRRWGALACAYLGQPAS